MAIEKFEDLIAWQKSKDLVFFCYKGFRDCKDFSFRDQIQRAAVSVMNNIAEGFERLGNKEFKKFLYISKGSCGEVRSMLYLALELHYIDRKAFDILYEKSEETSRILSGLIKKIEAKIPA